LPQKTDECVPLAATEFESRRGFCRVNGDLDRDAVEVAVGVGASCCARTGEQL
jgi:hypothetical protein